MFTILGRKIRGYSHIKLKGAGTERFINIAIKKNYDIWNVTKCENGIEMYICTYNKNLMNDILEKTGCSIEIIKKYGIAYFFLKHNLKLFFLIGIFLFMIIIYTLGLFIWDIQIKGNERIDKNKILEICSDNMLKIGVLKNSVNLRSMENTIKDNIPEISWIRINYRGTCADIKIAENIPPISEKKEEPCNITAKCDSIILSITSAEGIPLVKAGDVVKKDDILISGYICAAENEVIVSEKYVHSNGIIKGKYHSKEKTDIPYIYYTKEFSGNKTSNLTLSLFGNNIALFPKTPQYEKYDTVNTEDTLYAGKDFALPIKIKKSEYVEYTLKKNKYTKEEAIKKGEDDLRNTLYEKFDPETVKEIKYHYSEKSQEITIWADAIIEGDIGKETLIDLSTQKGLRKKLCK